MVEVSDKERDFDVFSGFLYFVHLIPGEINLFRDENASISQ